jgi:ABC-type amino acid transport system permease subunit
MEILLWVAVIFIVLVFLLSLVQRHFEKKWRIVR